MNSIKKEILRLFPNLNKPQREAVFHSNGPLLIIAGPGTGKTFVLVLRTLYLILSKQAEPSEIILTTFTEKASFELRDRIHQIAKTLGVNEDLHEIKIGTIHSICDTFISQFLHYTSLGKNYLILDDLTQQLFIYENFRDIITAAGEEENYDTPYFGRWKGKWTTIKRLTEYFNKITEELIPLNNLLIAENEFIKRIAKAYKEYEKLLYEKNRVDFAHLQKIFLDLLKDKTVYKKIKSHIKYIMVDEYQDTNYIQEQITLKLSEPEYNLCVVGDEDQALYRFRGATVRNILEFPKHFKGKNKCKIVKLQENYRSHKKIISAYNKFMNSVDWSGEDGKFFRFPNKTVLPSKTVKSPNYPAMFSVWTNDDEKDEAERIADIITFLKKNKIINDYSDIAILLKSVRSHNSAHYTEAFERRHIPFFNPRAKAYFENEEVEAMIACYMLIFGYEYSDTYNSRDLMVHIENGLEVLREYIRHPISKYIQRKREQIEALKKGESLDLTPGDYFYQLLAYEPFSNFLNDKNKARNLSIFSRLINTFQTYYHIPLITYSNKDFIKLYLFNSFLNLLIKNGLDEFEDPDNPIPKGYVQIMTIHQSKGLEFPVVIVGTLDKRFRSEQYVDRDLSSFYPRGKFEPEDKVSLFDGMRQFYVAFSRAKNVLILSSAKHPNRYFAPIWEGLEQWPYIDKNSLKHQNFDSKPPFTPKKTYSLTSHIDVYETCPRQYLFYKEYEFTPLRAGQILFGTLVHQTIEDIHRTVLDGRMNELNNSTIQNFFERNYKSLLALGMRPLARTSKESAFKQVITYFDQNKDLLKRVQETEVDVSIERNDYIITGKIDLVLGKDGKLELLDFKTHPKPEYNDPIIERYKKQLALYAFILKNRYGKNPERLYIYWTSEERRRDALMEIPYDDKLIEEAGKHFDEIVKKIKNEEFDINKPPSTLQVCTNCDFRFLCQAQGIINLKKIKEGK